MNPERTRYLTSHRVPVGATPVSPYATWDEHRAAIHRTVESRHIANDARLHRQ